MKVRLFNVLAYHRATGHIHRWHIATQPGYQSRAGDDPPAVTWLPLVKTPSRLSISVLTWGKTAGDAKVEPGTIALATAPFPDRVPRWANVFDVTAGVWLRVPLPSRPINILLTDYVVQSATELEVEQGATYASARAVSRLRFGIPAPRADAVEFPAWDTRLDFDTPFAPESLTYAGTGGYEGPSALKGTTLERCVGWCPMVKPTYLGVIDGLHRWSVSGRRRICDVPRGWSGGVAMTAVSGTPASNQYSPNLTNGIISTAVKYDDFRVEVMGELASDGSWPHTVGTLVAYLALTAGLAVSAQISAMEAVPRTVGYWVGAGDGTTLRAVNDVLCRSVPRGGWYMDAGGGLVVTRLPRVADAVPRRTYTVGVQGRGAATLTPLDPDRDVPAKKAIVLFAENSSPGTAASGASADDTALWTIQWREAPSAENAAVAAAWGAAAKVERVETKLVLRVEAEADAPLWCEELSQAPQPYELHARDGAPGIGIGDGVKIIGDLPGYETGAVAVVYGRRSEADGTVTLFVVRPL